MATAPISIIFGIIIGLLASFVQSLGLTFQRKSHVLNQQLPEYEQRAEHRRPLWLLGFAIFISSNILGSLVQIASLPVVILAPLGAVSLLWNAFFARILLGDVFSPWMILGTLFIGGGASLIGIFGVVPEPTRDLEDLLTLFRRPAFVAYFSLLGVAVVVCLAITHIVEFSFSRRLARALVPSHPNSNILNLPTDPNPFTTRLSETVAEATVTERTPLLDRKPDNRSPSSSSSFLFRNHSENPSIRSIHRTRLLLAISYASFSGILSGMCLVFAKSGVELLVLTLRGNNQFWRWQAWMLVLGLVGFALLQLWYMHKALKLADPTLVCPSAFCFYNLSSIVNGLVYFDQFSLLSPLHLGLVSLGIVVLLGGVWVVSIQSGGGGVDIVAWTPESEDSDDESLSIGASDAEDEASSLSMPYVDVESGVPKIISPPSMATEWGTRSEPNMDVFSTSPPPLSPTLTDRPLSPTRSNIPSSQSNIEHRLAESFSSRSQRHKRRPTVDSYNHTFRSPSHRTSGHRVSHSAYTSPPLPSVNTVSSIASSGFQIGLSPLSPGFSIVPLERRRRVSNLGPEESPSMRSSSRHTTDPERRRTVSEGDVIIRRQASAVGRSRPSETEEIHGDRHGRGRAWRWLRGITRLN